MERVKADGVSSGRISPASEAAVRESKVLGQQPPSPEQQQQQQQQQTLDSPHHQDSADERQVTNFD
jgi:hypothetical protein